jgi:hypothetical protein
MYEDDEYENDWRHEAYKSEYDCGDWTTCGTKNGHTGLSVRDRRAWECVNTWRDLESCEYTFTFVNEDANDFTS